MWELKKNTDGSLGSGEYPAFLGKDATFTGVLNYDGTLQVDGHFEGDIFSKGSVVIGEHGVVKGKIITRSLTSSGKIQGAVTASEKVHLHQTAVLIGNIHTPVFSMEAGAYYRGMCDMGASPWVDEERHPVEKVHDLVAHRGRLRGQSES